METEPPPSFDTLSTVERAGEGISHQTFLHNVQTALSLEGKFVGEIIINVRQKDDIPTTTVEIALTFKPPINLSDENQHLPF